MNKASFDYRGSIETGFEFYNNIFQMEAIIYMFSYEWADCSVILLFSYSNCYREGL